MSSKRVDWIDVCKGILIATIVLMHIDFPFLANNSIGIYISNFTSLYKVSIFFCVAGLTLKDEKIRNTKEFIRAKIKKLWSKIVIVGLAAVIFHNVLISMGFYGLGMDYKGKIMGIYGFADFLKQSLLTLFMANREVIIGPMWYADVLFMSMILLAIIDLVIRTFIKNHDTRMVRFLVTLCLMLVSSVMTNVLNVTIPRFNNTLTATFLIDLCQLLYRRLKWKFDNIWMFIVTFLILANLPLYGHLAMTNNFYENPAFLIVVAICGMYVLYFVSQKLTGGSRKFFLFIGKQSFWIMAMHFMAFKIGSVGLSRFMAVKIESLVPHADNFIFVIFYFAMGIFVPCLMGLAIDGTKKMMKGKADG